MALDWNTHVAQIIGDLEKPNFARSLSDGLKSVVSFDYTVIFGYVGTAKPLALYDDFSPERRDLHVDQYVEGPYLLDPFFLASTGKVKPGLWRLSDIAPDRFYQGEYFRSYYAQTGLAEEIGYLVTIHEQLSIVVSLMRKSKRFSKSELKLLQSAWPVVDASCKRNWAHTANETSQLTPALEEKIELAFQSIGEGILTPREREVVEHTLRGHSADAVGKLLGISSGTVRIHRRNIYSKLRINSQGELFSAFLSSIMNGQS
ncbi:helix-turn-helix transcriptional regulator [Ruegeria arenilitoris]|uniref:helix-turn-helix transcriptional regulator n=1 Tax=Ruegeria arenilitoris TaxID=1173585 RepID=UPI00147F1D50|nr:LuxR family transcriptional regulator [Ruegeria arenilitoris]